MTDEERTKDLVKDYIKDATASLASERRGCLPETVYEQDALTITASDVLKASDAVMSAIKAFEVLKPIWLAKSPNQNDLPFLYLARARLEETSMYLDRYINTRALTFKVQVAVPTPAPTPHVMTHDDKKNEWRRATPEEGMKAFLANEKKKLVRARLRTKVKKK